MTKYLFLCEKATLMKKIKAVATTMPEYKNADYVALFGHITTAKGPDQIDPKWKQWNFETLPITMDKLQFVPIINKETGQVNDIFLNIQKLVSNNKYDVIVNACDPEREGQVIFQNVYDLLGVKTPIKRFWTNDLTEDCIKTALQNLRYDNDGKSPNLQLLTQSALLRQLFDYCFGMSGTRAASVKRNTITHIGRVKSSIEKIVVDRELAIRNFVPKTSYGLEAIFNGFEADYVEITKDEDGKNKYNYPLWDTKEEAENIAKGISRQMKILSTESSLKKELAPALYTTSEVQADASKAYGYSIGETLATLQSLYEKEITSYPRTDNECISTEICSEFSKILEAIECVPTYGLYAAKFKNDKQAHERVKKTKKYVNDKKMAEAGHYAIIPTGKAFNYDSLSSMEQNVLKLIAGRTVSIFADPMQYKQVEVVFDDGKEHYFRTIGKTLVSPGYYDVINKEFFGKNIPEYKEGQNVSCENIGTHESTTTPPERFTDAILLRSVMANPTAFLKDASWKNKIKEVKGIGTEATRTKIVSDLVEQGYFELKKGKGKVPQIYASEKAIKIIQELGDTVITSVDMTAMWEQNLSEVESGQMSPEEFKKKMNIFLNDVVEEIKNSNIQKIEKSLNQQMSVLGKCPMCGNDIVAGKKYYFCKNYKKEADCKFILGREVNGAPLAETEVKKILEGKATKKLKMKNKDGKEFEASLKWDDANKKMAFVFDNKTPKETKFQCPICGQSHMNKADGKYGVYYKCPSCSFIFSEVFNKHKLSASEIKTILSGGKTEPIEFTKKDNSGTYNASLFLDKTEKKIKLEFAKK